jgi:hypothetical protein
MGQTEIRPAVIRDASYVAANLRALDRREAFCQLADSVREHELAWGLLEASTAYTAFWRGQPAAIFGTSPISVTALTAWMLGTRHARRTVPAITRFMLDYVVPWRIANGFRVMEARSIEDHSEAHRWMEATGAKLLTPKPFEWGKTGEKFVLYQWRAADFMEAKDRWKSSSSSCR